MTTHFNPADVLNGTGGIATWSAQKLGDGPWSGTAVTKDERELKLEQLASSWKVTDVYADRASSASSLELALKKAGIQ